MSKLLTLSFIVDILAGLGTIAYGVYSSSNWWIGGGVAGLLFSFVWRKVQPRLLGKFMHKRKGTSVSSPSPETAQAPAASTVEQSPIADVLAGRLVVSPGEPHPETGITWNRFSAQPPKKGQLRYY